MQEYSSSSFLSPIHPTQSSSKAGAACLPQGSTATQTSFLIQDKIPNALKRESGQCLGAELRSTSPEILCSLHTPRISGCPGDAAQVVLPTPSFVQSLLPHFSPSPVLIWDPQHALTRGTSQTHDTLQSQGGFPAANIPLLFQFMHCITNNSLSQYLKHSAGLNFPTRLREPRHILSFPLPADSCNPETAEGGCTFSPSQSYATLPRPGMKASLCPKTKALSFY